MGALPQQLEQHEVVDSVGTFLQRLLATGKPKPVLTAGHEAAWRVLEESTAREAELLSLPNDRDEWWKYTNPRLILSLLESGKGIGAVELVTTGLESVPQEANGCDFDVLSQLLPDDLPSRSMLSLQQLLVSAVQVIRIPRGVAMLEPVVVRATPQGMIGSYLTLLIVEPGAKVEVVEEVHPCSGDSWIAGRTEIVVQQGGECRYTFINAEPSDTTSLFRLRGHVGRDATLDVTYAALGSKLSRSEIDCFMVEAGCTARVRAVSLGDGKRHLDLHTNQLHLAPNCFSELTAKAVMSDKARSVYYGYIRVAAAAHGTDAYQTSRNLLLSSDARADTVPNLKIEANEVKCSHGASVARPNDEEIFYMQCRGITRSEAERLLVSGFLGEVIAKTPGSCGRARLAEVLRERGMYGE